MSAGPLEGLAADLRRLYPAGCVEADGKPVGAWYVSGGQGGGARTLRVAWTGRHGGPAAAEWPLDGEDPAEVARALALAEPGPSAGPFGHVVRTMDALARTGNGTHSADARGCLLGHARASDALATDPDGAKAVVRGHVRSMGAAFAPYLATLDPEALDFNAAWPPLRADEWPGVDGAMTPGAPLRRALLAFPGFHATLRRSWRRTGEPSGVAPGEVEAVLAREVASLVGLSARAMASPGRLADLQAARDASTEGWDRSYWAAEGVGSGRDAILSALSPLADLPVDWLPRRQAGWSAYLAVHRAVEKVRDLFREHAPMPPGSLAGLLGHGGHWDAFNMALSSLTARAYGTHWWSDDWKPADLVADASDFVDALVDQVVMPAAALEGVAADRTLARACALSALSSGRRLRNLLERSVEWHLRFSPPALPAGPGSPLSVPWEAHLPDAAAGDLSLVVLVTASALADEGRRGTDVHGREGLRHCVGTYAGDCRDGVSRIASVRRHGPGGDWGRVSTVEFRRSSEGLHVAQHRGARNGTPPADAEALVTGYALEHRGHDADWASDDPGDVDRSGYDTAVPGNWKAVLAAWEPFLPRGMRGLHREAWASLPGTLTGLGYDGTWRPGPFVTATPAPATP